MIIIYNVFKYYLEGCYFINCRTESDSFREREIVCSVIFKMFIFVIGKICKLLINCLFLIVE